MYRKQNAPSRGFTLIELMVTLAVAAVLMGLAAPAGAETRQRLRIEVGRAEVVSYPEDVRTVAIAEPKIANAAVGSARTVVVNAKSPGITTLVIYGEGARYNTYDVEVVQPNGHQQVKLAVRVAEADSNASRELGLDGVGSGSTTDGSLRGGLFTTKVSTPSDPLGLGPATDGFASYARPTRLRCGRPTHRRGQPLRPEPRETALLCDRPGVRLRAVDGALGVGRCQWLRGAGAGRGIRLRR